MYKIVNEIILNSYFSGFFSGILFIVLLKIIDNFITYLNN